MNRSTREGTKPTKGTDTSLFSVVRRCLRCVVLGSVAFVVVFAQAPRVSAQMPDPKQMSGLPLPVPDLAVGTVTARVFRGQLSNPIEGQSVEVTGAGSAKTSKTDASGRATFTGLTPGARVKVTATVNGEHLESREFEVPAAGGVRLLLVATDASTSTPGATGAQAPPVAGSVVFGGESRFVIEAGDDALNVFNILQIVNVDQRPVQAAPLVFELPDGAVGVGLLDGAPKTAVAAGNKVTMNGPYAPGVTTLQFAYSIPLGRDTIVIAQRLPAAMPQLSVVVQKVGAMQLDSPQIAQRREMPADGNLYIVGQGGALKAGDTVSLTLSGLPARPLGPRVFAVTRAVLVIAAGAWAAAKRPRESITPSRRNLQTRRERLFADLASLETDRRTGALDPAAYAARRESLVTALEDLYRGLDREVA